MAVPDTTLIQQALQGNNLAFSQLVNRHQRKVLYLAYDLTGNYEDAKDVAQEAFIRAFQKLAQFQQRSRFSTWLYRVTYNCAIDFQRKKARQIHDSLEAIPEEILHHKLKDDSGGHFEFDIERKETRKALFHALDKLSYNQRAAMILKYFHEKSSREISEIMGCSDNTVRIHVSRALKKLKVIMNVKPS